jgi:hypothetical protein
VPAFLIHLLVRIGLGECLEAARSDDYRGWFGFLFLFPVALGVFGYFGHSLIAHADGMAIWLLLTAFGVLFLVAQLLWTLFVPAWISLTLGVITWFALLWMAWHGKLLF